MSVFSTARCQGSCPGFSSRQYSSKFYCPEPANSTLYTLRMNVQCTLGWDFFCEHKLGPMRQLHLGKKTRFPNLLIPQVLCAVTLKIVFSKIHKRPYL